MLSIRSSSVQTTHFKLLRWLWSIASQHHSDSLILLLACKLGHLELHHRATFLDYISEGYLVYLLPLNSFSHLPFYPSFRNIDFTCMWLAPFFVLALKWKQMHWVPKADKTITADMDDSASALVTVVLRGFHFWCRHLAVDNCGCLSPVLWFLKETLSYYNCGLVWFSLLARTFPEKRISHTWCTK